MSWFIENTFWILFLVEFTIFSVYRSLLKELKALQFKKNMEKTRSRYVSDNEIFRSFMVDSIFLDQVYELQVLVIKLLDLKLLSLNHCKLVQ